MGYKHISDLLLDPEFSLKEHVEKMNIVTKNSVNNTETNVHRATYADVLVGGNSKDSKTKEQVCESRDSVNS